MRYVIIRDDDTNALTPVECLEWLYRPFLDRGLAVNLAVIPDVANDATMPDGKPEGFLFAKNGVTAITAQTGSEDAKPHLLREVEEMAGVRRCSSVSSVELLRSPSTCPPPRASLRGEGGITWSEPSWARRETAPIGSNARLVRYLRDNPLFHVVQHGCRHDYFEFDRDSRAEISHRLDRGTRLLMDAGFPRPETFVAPHDKLSRTSFEEVSKRFAVISSGWYEFRRLPPTWWPKYAMKKIWNAPHWRVNGTMLLSHPGCLLSFQRPRETMLEEIIRITQRQQLTVLVTHWWEYFRNGEADEPFISVLHETADYLARQSDVKIVSFSALADGK